MGGGYLSNLSIKKTRSFIFIVGAIFGIIVGGSIGVYAASTLNSNLVLYDNDRTSVSNVKEALDELFEKTPKLLSDIVSVGDYVSYDAGMWTSSADRPTKHNEFGGYIKGLNKANSVNWCQLESHTTSLKGWRVLKIENDKVYLVHAGQPECAYFANGGDSATNIPALNNRAKSEYLNSTYAESAHMMNYNEAVSITGNTNSTTNNLRTTGDTYLLATAINSYSSYYVSIDGGFSGYYSHSFGIRPVVVLKPNIKTTGKTTDAVGQEAWSLVAP